MMATSPLYHHITHGKYLFPLLFLALTVRAQVRWQFRKPQHTQTNVTDNSTVSNDNITMFTVTLPVDHNGTTTETFENRYWIDDSYWVEGGPIMRMSPSFSILGSPRGGGGGGCLSTVSYASHS